MRPTQAAELDVCPFIDEEAEACAEHFTLGHLSEAMHDCVGGYRGCVHYWKMLQQRPARWIALTCHGQSLAPTGS